MLSGAPRVFVFPTRFRRACLPQPGLAPGGSREARSKDLSSSLPLQFQFAPHST
jgi:hypothetical protein